MGPRQPLLPPPATSCPSLAGFCHLSGVTERAAFGVGKRLRPVPAGGVRICGVSFLSLGRLPLQGRATASVPVKGCLGVSSFSCLQVNLRPASVCRFGTDRGFHPPGEVTWDRDHRPRGECVFSRLRTSHARAFQLSPALADTWFRLFIFKPSSWCFCLPVMSNDRRLTCVRAAVVHRLRSVASSSPCPFLLGGVSDECPRVS